MNMRTTNSTSNVVDNQENTANLAPEKSLDEQISDIKEKLRRTSISDAEQEKLLAEFTKLKTQRDNLSVTETTKNPLEEIRDQIKKLLEGKKKKLSEEDTRKLKELHKKELQIYNHNDKATEKIQHKANIKSVLMEDLMKQLEDKDKELNKTKSDYDALLMADETLITPAESVRRRRLRNVLERFNQKGTAKDKLLYFVSRTSFFLGGKLVAGRKKLALSISSISKFNFLGTGQLNFIKTKVQDATDELKPEDGDSITVTGLKNKLRDDVKKSFDELLQEAQVPQGIQL